MPFGVQVKLAKEELLAMKTELKELKASQSLRVHLQHFRCFCESGVL